jgi:hypothetical protein
MRVRLGRHLVITLCANILGWIVDVALHLPLRGLYGKTNERRTVLRGRRALRYWASRTDTRRRADTV